MSTFRLAVLTAAIVAAPNGSDAAEKNKDKRQPASSTAANAPTATKLGLVAAPAAPITHKILADDRSNADQRVMTIGIDRRGSATEVTAIAQALVKPAANGHETALVNFQLDADRGTDRIWAVARVGRDVKVQFIGLSPDEITQMRAEAANDGRSLIGSWLTEPPLSAGRITLYRDAGAPFLEWRLRGGTKTTVAMIETRQQGNTAFIDKTGGDERFVLTATGELEVRDASQNVVAVGQKIEAFAPLPIAAPAPAAKPVVRLAGTRVASLKPTSAALLAPPPPPDNKPQPRFTGKRSILPPTWQVRILP